MNIKERIEAHKLRNTYGPKMSPEQQYRNLMVGLAESVDYMTPEEVDEYLKEEGYNLDKLDKKGKELFDRLQASNGKEI